ncbi:MAG: hypothetical protein N2C14_28415, partial [Planctomycetales bacterium]
TMDVAVAMRGINDEISHLWMVRTFLKHCEEAEEDPELRAIPRAIYDYCLALGPPWKRQDAAAFVKTARKKFTKLRRAAEEYADIQPDVSMHTNFAMAAQSLALSVQAVGKLLEDADP